MGHSLEQMPSVVMKPSEEFFSSKPSQHVWTVFELYTAELRLTCSAF